MPVVPGFRAAQAVVIVAIELIERRRNRGRVLFRGACIYRDNAQRQPEGGPQPGRLAHA